MNIKAGNFTLKSDPYNLWITETIKGKDGKEYEAKVAGYSPTFRGLLNSFIKKEIRKSDAKSFNELYADIEKLEKKLEEINKLCDKGGRK